MDTPLRAPLAAAVALLLFTGPVAHAGLNTYYEEDFTGEEGHGITMPGLGSNPDMTWIVNGNSAQPDMEHAQVIAPGVFEFSDLGGNNAQPSTLGRAVFETIGAMISVSNPAHFSFLTMTLNATFDPAVFEEGESLLIESLLDGNVVDTTTITMAGPHNILHDLSDDVMANTTHNYVLRITSTQFQEGTPSHTIDNIFVQGLSVPEPASMSLLGMGVAAMCTAGYRRRRKADNLVDG